MSDDEEFPFVVYVAREKRPSHPHNFKAGALNVLVINFTPVIYPKCVMHSYNLSINIQFDLIINVLTKISQY